MRLTIATFMQELLTCNATNNNMCANKNLHLTCRNHLPEMCQPIPGHEQPLCRSTHLGCAIGTTCKVDCDMCTCLICTHCTPWLGFVICWLSGHPVLTFAGPLVAALGSALCWPPSCLYAQLWAEPFPLQLLALVPLIGFALLASLICS
jgi:hypothetical protein